MDKSLLHGNSILYDNNFHCVNTVIRVPYVCVQIFNIASIARVLVDFQSVPVHDWPKNSVQEMN